MHMGRGGGEHLNMNNKYTAVNEVKIGKQSQYIIR